MCIIAFVKHNNDNILVKNRDRVYNARIKIIHEIKNGVEVAYLFDTDSNWIEGMNEFGIALVNSALLVKHDEEEGLNSNKGSDGKKILKALSYNSLKDTIKSTLIYHGDSDKSLKGHTLVGNPNNMVHIESTSKNKPVINKLSDNIYVLTNHGINTNSGYKNGRKRVSSIVRKEIIEYELKNILNTNNYKNIVNAFNKNYIDIDPRYHPYRDQRYTGAILKNKNSDTIMFSTTSQIIMNLTRRELNIITDKYNCTFIGFENKLPKGYQSKIKVNIYQGCKDNNLVKSPISDIYIKYIKNLYKKRRNRFIS